MTPFALLLSLSGLSQREAADFLAVSASSVDKWTRGVRDAPRGALAEMRDLIRKQVRAAQEALAVYRRQHAELGKPVGLDLMIPADDAAAQDRGWPCRSAAAQSVARIIAALDVEVDLH